MDTRQDYARFDDRRVISAIVAKLRALGGDLDTLDVELSLRGPVDLDLLQDCLRESYTLTHPTAARAA